MSDGPKLLVSTPLTDRLAALEERAADFDRWQGDGNASAKAIRLCIDEVRDAMREAEESWRPLIETAALTGWHESTLSAHAKAQKDGEPLPYLWRKMESQMTPSGYRFRVSSVPEKPAKAG